MHACIFMYACMRASTACVLDEAFVSVLVDVHMMCSWTCIFTAYYVTSSYILCHIIMQDDVFVGVYIVQCIICSVVYIIMYVPYDVFVGVYM